MKAEWIIEEDKYIDDWVHHKCSNCNASALYDCIMEEDWDYDWNENPFSWGLIQAGINEHITDFCPNCGAEMNCANAIHYIHGCKACIRHCPESCNYGYTEECEDCGDCPWANDELPSKWEMKN